LVLTDFSPPSQRAVETAIAFNPDSNVTVLHVCDAMPTVMGEDKLEILRNELSAKLTGTVCNGKNASNGGSKKQGCKIDTALEFGDTLNVIEYYVADNQPQLVVVGTHGRTGFMRAVLGSVAENLLKILPCDVLVVGSPDEAK
jgi:nucleotide-binding universal stress UspA family protein